MTIEELPLSMLRGPPFNLQGGGGEWSLCRKMFIFNPAQAWAPCKFEILIQFYIEQFLNDFEI